MSDQKTKTSNQILKENFVTSAVFFYLFTFASMIATGIVAFETATIHTIQRTATIGFICLAAAVIFTFATILCTWYSEKKKQQTSKQTNFAVSEEANHFAVKK